MKKNDKNYLLQFTLTGVDGNAIDFTATTDGAPIFTTADVVTTHGTTTTTTPTGEVEIKVLGKGPNGTTKSTAVTGVTASSAVDWLTTVTASDVFTNEAGDWQLQVQIDKLTGLGPPETHEVYLSDPVTITVWEALS